VSAGRIFSDLKARFDQAAQHNLLKYWEERDIDSIAHRDFLGVSWRGSEKYLVALGFQAETDDHQKKKQKQKKQNGWWSNTFGIGSVGPPPNKKKKAEEFKKASEDKFNFECLIFFKSASVSPRGYTEVQPNNLAGFAEAPLHHYLMVRRHQTKAPAGRPAQYTQWKLEDRTFREAADLVEFLVQEIFPGTLIEKTEDCGFDWLAFILGMFVGAFLALGPWYALDEEFRDLANRRLGEARQTVEGWFGVEDTPSNLTDVLEDHESDAPVRGGYSTLLRPRSQEQTLATCSGVEAALETCQSERDSYHDQLNSPVVTARAGLDLPPCWHPEPETPSTPVYLFDVFADRAGLRVTITDAALARSDVDDWPLEEMVQGEVITIDQFARGAASIYARSELDGCRHFVVLREGEHDSAAQYQAQRDMVERYFYIYRP